MTDFVFVYGGIRSIIMPQSPKAHKFFQTNEELSDSKNVAGTGYAVGNDFVGRIKKILMDKNFTIKSAI